MRFLLFGGSRPAPDVSGTGRVVRGWNGQGLVVTSVYAPLPL